MASHFDRSPQRDGHRGSQFLTDIFRTVGNVTADLPVLRIAGRPETIERPRRQARPPADAHPSDLHLPACNMSP